MALVQPPPPELTEHRQGHYAGAVSRGVAFGVDIGVIWGLFALGAYAVSLAIELIVGHTINISKYQVATLVAVIIWGFLYFAYQWTVGGRTIGMALLGLQVVKADGNQIGGREAVIRTVTLPLSFIVFYLGLLGILTNRERRAWHDKFAGTAVVYAWDARAARLRWLARKAPTSTPHG